MSKKLNKNDAPNPPKKVAFLFLILRGTAPSKRACFLEGAAWNQYWQ